MIYMREDECPFYSIGKISKQIGETLNGYSKVIGEIVSKISEASQILAEQMAKIELPKLDTSLVVNIQYIMTMHKLKYPLFLESNEEFKKSIVDCKDNELEIVRLIYNYINEDYLQNMVTEWEKSVCIRAERLPIFKEAIELHKSEYYFASTSLMMCQLYGVVIDIYNYINTHEIEVSEDSKSYIANLYNIDKIDSEKGKLFQLAYIPDGGTIIKDVIVDYFQKEVLSSSDSKKRWEHQPLRNKICHGDQLNYGTKEHSLKAIMCINLLIVIGEEIKGVIDNMCDG